MAMETENKHLAPQKVKIGVNTALSNQEYGFYLLAESNGNQVGQLMITKEWSDWRNGEFWWVQSVYVQPDYRGKGIYIGLYEKVKEFAKSDGKVCGIRLYVDNENEVAQKAYSKLGMTKTNYLLYEEDWTND
jgi:GNAT superfamily N-acetyltransferase